MNKIALCINVCADDWTPERAIIASNEWPSMHFASLIYISKDLSLCMSVSVCTIN